MPGTADSIAMGIPQLFLAGLSPMEDEPHHGRRIFLTFSAWETTSSADTTVTIQVCNPSEPYRGGDSGTIRVDLFKH
jgi:hypothetical protein